MAPSNSTSPPPKSPKRNRLEDPPPDPSAPSKKQGTAAADQEEEEEEIDHDHICPICHLLLVHPVTTRCNHTLCAACMSHWADVSLASQMTIVPLDDDAAAAAAAAAAAVEAKCPMCRTPTVAVPDAALAARLRERYPGAYAARVEEEGEADGKADGGVEVLTLFVGNTHQRVVSERSANTHDWTFFVRTARTDVIEEVQIFLHPTFRPPHIIKRAPPYEIRRLGWGYFTITAHVVLKPGYSWLSEDAEDAPNGVPKGLLPLDWTLDFNGDGSQGRCRLKVKSEEWEWEDVSEGPVIVPWLSGIDEGEGDGDEEDSEGDGAEDEGSERASPR